MEVGKPVRIQAIVMIQVRGVGGTDKGGRRGAGTIVGFLIYPKGKAKEFVDWMWIGCGV